MRTQFTCDEVAQLAKYVTTDGMVQPITPMNIEDWCIRECERKWPGSWPELTCRFNKEYCFYSLHGTPVIPVSDYHFEAEGLDRLTALVELVIQIGEAG